MITVLSLGIGPACQIYIWPYLVMFLSGAGGPAFTALTSRSGKNTH